MVDNGLDFILRDLLDKLNSIQRNGEYVFKFTSVFNNQIDRLKKGEAYNIQFPACFIDLKIANGGYIGDLLTVNDIIVTFRVVNWELDSAMGSMDQNFNIFDLRDIVKYEMALFKPTGSGFFQWYGDTQNFDHDNLYEFILKYRFHSVDFWGQPLQNGKQVYYVGATPSLNLSATYSGWTGSNPII